MNTTTYPTSIHPFVLLLLKNARTTNDKSEIFYRNCIGFESDLILDYLNQMEVSETETEDILYYLRILEEEEITAM